MTTISMAHGNRRRAAQAGLAARGLLYLIVGVLALQVALGGGGGGGEQASQEGALRQIAQQGAWGTFLVGLVGLGLVAYAFWRLTQFFIEKGGDEDNEAKAWIVRISYLVRAVIYAGLAFVAFRIALGSGGGGGGNSQQTVAATIMKDVPGGRLLVGLVGLIIIGVGAYQAYKAFTDDFMEQLRTGQMNPTTRTWVRRVGVLGYSARAVTYGLIGLFVLLAAVQFDPDQAVGLDGALSRLAQQPFGPYLLGVTALGLFAYGAFTLVRARYVKVSE